MNVQCSRIVMLTLLVGLGACEDGSGALPVASGTDTADSAVSAPDSMSGAVSDSTSDSMGTGGTDSGGSATTDGTSSGTTGTTGADTAGLDEVEAACEADCDAIFSTPCAPTQNQNVLTCKLQCANITVQLGGFCLDEYTNVVQCRANGGYDCVNEYPTPKSTCAAEQAAFAECTQDLGCKRYCDGAIAAGCGGASFDGCLDGCLAERATLPEFCGYYYDGLPLCEAQWGIECIDGQPTTTGDCSYQVANIADCVADETDDLCQGYCYLTDALGCGTNCAQDCQSRIMDVTCGSQWNSLIDCQLRHGDFMCTDGRLVGIDICDSYEQNYVSCMTGG